MNQPNLQTMRQETAQWISYHALHEQNTCTGDIRVFPALHSPQLQNERDIVVWLPVSYEQTDHRYPVIYMHDGQNLFDANTAPFGEWRVDESMTALADEGIEAIIVGIPNTGDQRLYEYSPYSDYFRGTEFIGRGDLYLKFIVETVKPLIDSSFRTDTSADKTAIAGSSMGGLISLYGLLTYPEVFGLCGAFSPAYWFGSSGLINTVREKATGSGRVYMDVGTLEGPTLTRWRGEGADHNSAYVRGVRDVFAVLVDKGYRIDDTVRYVEDKGAKHNEAAWAARFPDAIRFLLRP